MASRRYQISVRKFLVPKILCFHSSEYSPGISLVCILVMKGTKMKAGLFWDLKLSIKRLLEVVVILETIFWVENSCRYSHGSVKYMKMDYKRARTWTSWGASPYKIMLSTPPPSPPLPTGQGIDLIWTLSYMIQLKIAISVPLNSVFLSFFCHHLPGGLFQ